TVEDPQTWTKPWTALIPWNKIDPGEQMYEYGCHEDNFDIVHFLVGARNRQKTAREAMRARLLSFVFGLIVGAAATAAAHHAFAAEFDSSKPVKFHGTVT